MERSTILDCNASYLLAQGGGVGGWLVVYFLFFLVVPSCSYLDQINEFNKIQIQN